MTDTELAYIAGLIDGEGHIGLTFVRRRGAGDGRYLHFRVSISNTDLRMLRWVRDRITGGSIGLNRQAKRPVWCLTLGKKAGVELLTAVLPYLVAKRDQAELFLAAADALPTHRRAVYAGVVNLEARRAAVERMAALKRAEA